MDKLTFTIDLKNLNDYDDPEEIKRVAEDMSLLFQFLKNCNPNYYLVGDILDKQLKEQLKETNSKQEMKEAWDRIFDEADLGFTAWDMHEHHGDEPIPGYFDAWDNFYKQIGEAMGPVCYAAYKLKMKFIEAGQYGDWVDECIDYYEKNWRF